MWLLVESSSKRMLHTLVSTRNMSLSKLNIQSVCSYFHIACTLVLFCAIPFYYSSFLQYGLIFFFVSFAADYLASKRWQQGFALDKTRIVSLLVLLQFVLLFVYSFFEADTRYLSTIYEYRTSFLGFGLIGLLGVSDKFRVRHFAYTVPLAVIAFLIVLYGYLPESFFQLDLKKKLVEILKEKSENIKQIKNLDLAKSMLREELKFKIHIIP